LTENICAVLCLSFAVAISTSIAYSQQAASESKVSADQLADDSIQLMRQDIRSERKKIVAANMPLTEAEAVKFWPVYDRYVVDHSKVYDTRYALIKEYAQSYKTITDEQADSFIKRWTSTEEAMAHFP
jgi:hypothetical protein